MGGVPGRTVPESGHNDRPLLSFNWWVPAAISRLNDCRRAPQKGPVAIDRRGKFHVDRQQRSFPPLPSKQRQTQSSGCAKPKRKAAERTRRAAPALSAESARVSAGELVSGSSTERLNLSNLHSEETRMDSWFIARLSEKVSQTAEPFGGPKSASPDEG
jgi:hypothetical protein